MAPQVALDSETGEAQAVGDGAGAFAPLWARTRPDAPLITTTTVTVVTTQCVVAAFSAWPKRTGGRKNRYRRLSILLPPMAISPVTLPPTLKDPWSAR